MEILYYTIIIIKIDSNVKGFAPLLLRFFAGNFTFFNKGIDMEIKI